MSFKLPLKRAWIAPLEAQIQHQPLTCASVSFISYINTFLAAVLSGLVCSAIHHDMFTFLFSYSLIIPWGLLEFLMIKYIILYLQGNQVTFSGGEETDMITNWIMCHQDQLCQQQPSWYGGGNRDWEGLCLEYSPTDAGKPTIAE